MAAIGTPSAGRIATAGVVEFGMRGRIHLGVCGARMQHRNHGNNGNQWKLILDRTNNEAT